MMCMRILQAKFPGPDCLAPGRSLRSIGNFEAPSCARCGHHYQGMTHASSSLVVSVGMHADLTLFNEMTSEHVIRCDIMCCDHVLLLVTFAVVISLDKSIFKCSHTTYK